MSELGWLPRGLEQHAPPITQLLPVSLERSYFCGGNKIIVDFSAANFNPHFWLFELGSAKWFVGYDSQQRPTYQITLIQRQVFSVLLVDFWQPPYELWRTNQPVVYGVHKLLPQDALPTIAMFSPDVTAVDASGSTDDAAFTPTWSDG